MNNIHVIKLDTSSKVKDFVSKMSTFECDIDVKHNNIIIDAKSIIGVFSLDLSIPVTIIIHTDNEEEIKRFNKIMEEFK